MQFQRYAHRLILMLSIVCGIGFTASISESEQAESDAVTKKFMPNVVQLLVTFNGQPIEHGFGFVVGERNNQLYVLTANHVVRKTSPDATKPSITATFCAYQAESYPAELSPIYNSTRDFAVLIVQKPLPDYHWERQSYDPTPEHGEQVWFIGRNAQCYAPAASGVIEKEDDDIKGKFAVTDNQVQPGTSGAPLISKQGIVGVITTDSLDGVFAVSIATIREFVRDKGVPWDLRKFGEDAVSTPAVPHVTPLPPSTPIPATPEPTPTVAATPIPAPTLPPTTSDSTSPACWQNPSAGRICVDSVIGMEFIWINGGCFQMGQSVMEKAQIIQEVGRDQYNSNFADESPQHNVCVDGFWMSRYELTNQQYRQFKSSHDSRDYQGHSLNGDDQPVVFVSWKDGQAFTKWLTNKVGNGVFRLPTEAEWEYAARAGTTTIRYWGDNPADACQYANVYDQTSDQALHNPRWKTAHTCDDGYIVTAPVHDGKRRPNAFGLYDMLGNVYEWCQDTYETKAYSNSVHQSANPLVRGRGGVDEEKIQRGGGWNRFPARIRAALRSSGSPDEKGDGVGFRLVRTPN